MGQSIATDAYWATATVSEIESQVEAALDWLRPPLLELAKAIQAGPMTTEQVRSVGVGVASTAARLRTDVSGTTAE